MARKRLIDPAIWTDPVVGNVSIPARLLYIGTWTLANDAGLLEGDPAFLKVSIFPYDRTRAAHVEKYIDELQAKGLLLPYEDAGRRYYVITNFNREQRVDHPSTSRLPLPPEGVLARLEEDVRGKLLARFHGESAKPVEDSRALANVREGSRTPPPNVTQRNPSEAKGTQGEETTVASATDAPAAREVHLEGVRGAPKAASMAPARCVRCRHFDLEHNARGCQNRTCRGCSAFLAVDVVGPVPPVEEQIAVQRARSRPPAGASTAGSSAA